jgi:hypothetical protein
MYTQLNYRHSTATQTNHSQIKNRLGIFISHNLILSDKYTHMYRKKNRLLTYLGASPCETLDAMYTNFLETCCSDNICDVMGIVQEILRELKEIEEDIARARVMGRRYINVQDKSKQATEVLSALEDLFSCVMVEDMDLRQRYCHILDSRPILSLDIWTNP